MGGKGSGSMLQDEVLSLLRSEPSVYRSGEEMSRRLGVSRAAVSQRRKTWQQKLVQMKTEQEDG